jgi:predicted amidohydrolase YtcJ
MELVLTNANVIPMAVPSKREQAIAIRDGRIVMVASSRAVAEMASANARVVDLQGRTVLPGFIDSHMHCFLTGLQSIAARLETARTVDDVCELVHQRARDCEPGQWVYGLGCMPWALREGRYPTIADLDRAAPRNPVYIMAQTVHSGAANSAAFRTIAIDPSTPGVEKDPAGRPTGSFLSDDTHFAAARIAFGALSDEEIALLYECVAKSVTRVGVTTLHCLDGQFIDDDRDVSVLLDVQHRLPVRTVLMYQTMDVKRAKDLGLPRIGGCLCVDGAGFDHTALMYEPYADAPETCGDCYIDEARIRSFVREAHAAGLQIGMHALGDRAVDILVRVYKEVMEASPREDCRHRVEHFYVPSDWAVEQAQQLGLALAMQPAFPWMWDRGTDTDYERVWGRERSDRAEPFRELCDRGLVISGGSDSPVTQVNPLLGIHSAANHPHPARRVGVEDALRMFTVNGAWVEFGEKEKGTIEIGKLADLVVVDGDPFLETARIKDFSVEMTIKGGEVVFERARDNHRT